MRGLGRWSCEMFACFGLKRLDVLSTGDLGVQYVHPQKVYSRLNHVQKRNGCIHWKRCQEAEG